MPITVGHDLEVAINTILTGYVNTQSAALIGNLSPFVIAAVTLYFMQIGYTAMYGELQDPIRDVARKWFWTAFLCAIALSTGTYQLYVIDVTNDLETGLLSSFGVGGNLGSSFDVVIQSMVDLLLTCWKVGSTSITQAVLMACVILMGFISLAIVVVVGLGSFLLAKVSIALLLAVGPFFLVMGIFPVTKKFMESWLGQCFQFVMVAVLVGMTASLISIMTGQFCQRVQAAALMNPVVDTFAIDLFMLGCAFVASKIETIAASITGGVGLADFSRGLAHFLTKERTLKPRDPSQSGNQVAKESMTRRGGRAAMRAGRALGNAGVGAVKRLYNA